MRRARSIRHSALLRRFVRAVRSDRAVDAALCQSDNVKLYSDFAPRRTRQIVADVVAIALILAWVWLGATVYGAIRSLEAFGQQMQDAGAGFRANMDDLGDRLGSVPLLGSGIRAPFDGASSAGSALEAAGVSQQELTQQLATTVGVGVALLPILVILAAWLIPRLRFAIRAGRTQTLVRTGVSLDLLALRALSNQRLRAIAAISPDALGAWQRRDPVVVKQLAALELQSSGIRVVP